MYRVVQIRTLGGISKKDEQVKKKLIKFNKNVLLIYIMDNKNLSYYLNAQILQ